MKNLKTIPFIFILSLFIACGSDSDSEEVNCTALQTEGETILTNFLSTALQYGFDPTPANCTAYKNALNEYIPFAEKARDCVEEDDLADYDKGVEEAKTALNDLDC